MKRLVRSLASRTRGAADQAKPAAPSLPGIPVEVTEAVPQALFSPRYYASQNPEVATSGLSPREHFATVGRRAGRAPSVGAGHVAAAIEQRATVSATPMADIVGLFPADQQERLRHPEVWHRLRACLHPAFYAAQLPGAEVPPGVDEALAHFLAHGAFQGARPSALFHQEWYLRQLAERGETLPAGVRPFFHWLTTGWDQQVVPTPLFDLDTYAHAHAALLAQPMWLFEHFVKFGCYEHTRVPSPLGKFHNDRGQVDRTVAAATHTPLLLPRLLEGVPARGDVLVRTSTPLEDNCMAVRDNAGRLRTPRMLELIEKAGAIEPDIHRPHGPRQLNVPPLHHGRSRLAQRAEDVRRAVGITEVDTIMLVPHCRMGGSSRVAGTLSKALVEGEPGARVLVVSTDLSDFERPDWFHDDIILFDLSVHREGIGQDLSVLLLLDLVRGLAPRRVVNVNSRLGWDLLMTYGRQLATTTTLGAYLFTWDLDRFGRKTGYPIREFRDAFDDLHWVLVDNAALRHDLIERYHLPRALQERIVVAHTPVAPSDRDLSSSFAQRPDRPLRAFWAGRFDRQKRFDVAIALAERMPELEIWAWGKAVLGGLDLDFEALPANIRLMGTFAEFDELPFDELDFLLYTAEWDGIPTILLDAATRGLPIVASDVGGVREVVNEETGFLVADALDVEGYVDAVRRLQADPAEVSRRAKALKTTVEQAHTEAGYLRLVQRLLQEDH